MNEEEEEASLEGQRVCRNHLAQEKHVARSKEQSVADASRWATQRATHSDVQIAADATRQVAQRVAHNDAQITMDATRQAGQKFTHSDAQIALEMLRVLTLERFYIQIGNKKRVMQIVRLTRANESNCRKNVFKKFEMLTVKHAVPSMNWTRKPRWEPSDPFGTP
jgi:hypothetical protein